MTFNDLHFTGPFTKINANLRSQALYLAKPGQKDKHRFTTSVFRGHRHYFLQKDARILEQFFVSSRIFVDKIHRSIPHLVGPFQKSVEAIEIIVLFFEFALLSHIYGGARIFRVQIIHFHFLKDFIFLAHSLDPVTIVIFYHFLLPEFGSLLLFNFYVSLIKILPMHKTVNFVLRKVVLEQFVINCSTHKDYSQFGMHSKKPLHRKKNKISIDIPFMDLVENNKGVFGEKFSAMHQSLQKNAICHEKNFSIFSNECLHSNMVSHGTFLRDLVR